MSDLSESHPAVKVLVVCLGMLYISAPFLSSDDSEF